MSELQFDEDTEDQKWSRSETREVEAAKPSLFFRLLEKVGIEERVAQYILYGILAISLVGTFFIIKGVYAPSENTTQTYQEDIPDNIRQTVPWQILDQLPSRATPPK